MPPPVPTAPAAGINSDVAAITAANPDISWNECAEKLFCAWNGLQQDGGHSDSPNKLNRAVKFRPMNPLCDAAEQGDLPTLTKLVATTGDVNILGDNGNSALAFACANGHADCASFLVAKGANVNQRSSLGNAPLHAACWADSKKCIRILLDGRADINMCSYAGATPMHVAIQGGRDEALETLIARGADRTIKSDGKTVLQLSLSLKHKACERVIRKADAEEAVVRRRIADKERAAAEKRANAAADALLAELAAEEAARGGGAASTGKKASKKKAKAERAAAAAAAADASMPPASAMDAPASGHVDGGAGAVRVLADAATKAVDLDVAEDLSALDDDAAMANALLGGSKTRRRSKQGGSQSQSMGAGGPDDGGGGVRDLLRAGADDGSLVSADVHSAATSAAAGESSGSELSTRRVVARCKYCGSRAKPTAAHRCPSCFADLSVDVDHDRLTQPAKTYKEKMEDHWKKVASAS